MELLEKKINVDYLLNGIIMEIILISFRNK